MIQVFDSKLWNGKDKGDNSQFWKLAEVVERMEKALKDNAEEAEAIITGGVLITACAIRIRDRALAALKPVT